MKKRIKILFRLFPDLQKIYHSISAFRGIYDVENFGNEILITSKKSLEKWIQKAGSSEISALQNFVHTVTEHKGNILAYFRTGKTNAFAESLNFRGFYAITSVSETSMSSFGELTKFSPSTPFCLLYELFNRSLA